MKRRIDHSASFKDPAARVFNIADDEQAIYRELNQEYLVHYHHFKSSGLAEGLLKKNYLIPFEEVQHSGENIILKATKIPFVAFPYEWTFNQWKDAALLTLKVQYHALQHGMILKDATPFNIVFDGCRPMFIDISSFEIYKEGKPWIAFKQFCENFYLPVLLHQYLDSTGNDVYQNNCNGISLHKGLSLLPVKAFFNFNTLFFLALPGGIRQRIHSNDNNAAGKFTVKKNIEFANHLFNNINRLKQSKRKTKWNDYYDQHTTVKYLSEKETVIKDWLSTGYNDKCLVDFGCNTGNFSRIAAPLVKSVIAFDDDIRSVDELYIYCKTQKVRNITALAANLCQPTPPAGWDNEERQGLVKRLCGDVGLALALIHHLAISNHIRFTMMASFFASVSRELFIEFVPKEDEKVQLLLANRQDIFNWYNPDDFKAAFCEHFNLLKEHRFSNNRILFHFIVKGNEQ